MDLTTIYLAIPGRLLRDCIESALQLPNRVIRSLDESLDHLQTGASGLPAPDLMIVRVGADADAEFEGFAAIRGMRHHWPRTRWIVLSHVIDINFVRDAIASGVDSFVYEDSSLEVLRLLTELVLLGHSLLPAHLASVLSAGIAHTPSDYVRMNGPRAPTGLFAERVRALSTREIEILRCVSEGQSNKMIARELDIAEATVKAHVKALLRKMQVANRTQAAIAAPGLLRNLDLKARVSNATNPAVPPEVRKIHTIPSVSSIMQLRSAVG